MVKETILAVQEAEAQASGLVSEARQKGKELAEQTRREARPPNGKSGKVWRR